MIDLIAAEAIGITVYLAVSFGLERFWTITLLIILMAYVLI